MKTKSKALLLVLSAVLLVVSSVMGTMAYLTDSDDVANTFTVGKVYINLDEAVVDSNGTAKTDGSRTEDGNKYNLIPGQSYDKDPTVTVEKGSEPSYVRMLVTVSDIGKLKSAFPKDKILNINGVNTAVYADYYNGEVFLLQALVEGWDNTVWIPVTENIGTSGSVTYEFRYNGIVDARKSDQVLDDLFEKINIPGYVNNEELAYLNAVEIKIVAQAIQAAGFENSADAAWAAFDEQVAWNNVSSGNN